MTEDLLFLLVRLGLGNSSARDESCEVLSSLDAAGWKALIDLAFEQGMASLAVDGLQKSLEKRAESLEFALDSPELEDLKYEWFGSVFQDEQDNKDQISVLKDMASRWAEEGCRMMLMKGQAAALYYPAPSHRTTGDIDCYFPGNYEKANSVAEKAGAIVDTHWYKHSQIHYKGEMFENHQYFVHTRDGKRGKLLNATLCSLLEGVSYKTFPDSQILLPPVMFNALFLTYHALAHFLAEGMRLKQVVDWAMFLKAEQDNIDWEKFYALCGTFHFKRFVDVMNDIAVHKLGVKVHNPLIATDSPYTDKVLHSIFHDKDFVFGSGKSGWANRLHLVTNLFKYSWKYHQIYQDSILKQLWYYASGYIFKTEV